MVASKLFAYLSQLIDVATARAAAVWPRFNADGTVSQLNAADTRAALGAGGIISNPNVAYINEDGDDDTAELGNPSKAFSTYQGAIDAGAIIWEVGYNQSGGDCDFSEVVGPTVSIYVNGNGLYANLGAITTGGLNLIIWDVGVSSFYVNSINTTPETPGENGGSVTLYNVALNGSIVTDGAQGSDVTVGTGGIAGDIILYGLCLFLADSSISANGGRGGNGDSETVSGNGGAGGGIEVEGPCLLEGAAITATGGAPGVDGGSGSGSAGPDGTITLIGSPILDAIPDPTPLVSGVSVLDGETIVAGNTHTAGTGSLTLGSNSLNVSASGTFPQTSVSGNAGTATALQTARTINGTSFNGTANITVTAAAGTLTGTTLNATVTASSLTSVGILASPTVSGLVSIVDNSGAGLTIFNGTNTFFTNFLAANATANRTINLPNASGTILLTNGSGASLTGIPITSGNTIVTNGFTYTLQGANATLARTDAAQTFTGVQTFNSGITMADGQLFNAGGVNSAIGFSGLANLKAASGKFILFNAAFSDSASIAFGGTTSSFPELRRSGTTITAGLADGTSGGSFAVSGTLSATGASTLTGGIVGTVTGGNATAGNVGEYVSASVVVGSATSLTTATPKTVTSITLSAGDWDITAIGALTGASTGTAFDVAIGTTTNSFTGTVLGDTRCQSPTVSLTGADASLMIPAMRVSISGSTTYYLVVQEVFTLGTPAAYGRISARRVR